MSEEIKFPVVAVAPVSWGTQNVMEAKGFKAVVNPDANHVYSIVSDDYRLIKHEEAAIMVEIAINDNPQLGKYGLNTEFYGEHDARMMRTYRFTDITTEIEPGDKVFPELHLFNSYDTVWPFVILLGAFRLVCENGLVVGREFLHLRKRHVFQIENDLKKQISKALGLFFSTNRGMEAVAE